MNKIVLHLLRFVGITTVIGFVIFNPYVLDNFFSPDKKFDFVYVYVLGVVLSFVGVAGGFFIAMRPQWVLSKKYELLLFFASLTFCFVAVEFSLRVYESTQAKILENIFGSGDPLAGTAVELGHMVTANKNQEIVYSLKPNLDVIFKDQEVVINSQGFRDEEFPTEKANGEIRIVGIGDSFMFGWGVSENERYLDRLESLLNSNFSTSTWTSYNLGVPGYNLVNIVATLKDYGELLKPDLIIYGHISNDHCLPYFLQYDDSFFSKRIRIFKYLNIYSLRSQGLYDYHYSQRQPLHLLCKQEQVPEKFSHLVGNEIFVQALGELVQYGEDNDSIVVMAGHYEKSLQKYMSSLEELDSRSSSFYLFDLSEELQEAESTSNQNFQLASDDNHFSSAANQIYAVLLLKELTESDIITKLLQK